MAGGGDERDEMGMNEWGKMGITMGIGMRVEMRVGMGGWGSTRSPHSHSLTQLNSPELFTSSTRLLVLEYSLHSNKQYIINIQYISTRIVL